MVVDRGNFSLFLALLGNQACWNNNRDFPLALLPMLMDDNARLYRFADPDFIGKMVFLQNFQYTIDCESSTK